MNRLDEASRAARRLAQVLVTHDDPDACAACQEALDDYIGAQLAAQDYAGQVPAVAAHLDACVDCAEEYALLYELRVAETHGPVPATIPQFNLDFLPAPTPQQPHTSLGTMLAAAVQRTGERLRVQL